MTTLPPPIAAEKEEVVKFELDQEHVSDLKTIFKGQEDKTKRLDARLERAHLNQDRIEELRKKLAQLTAKKKQLVETAAAAQESEKEAALAKSVPIKSRMPDDFDAFEENHADMAKFPKVPYDWWRGQLPYENKGPTVKGMVSSVFPDGQLFRIMTDSGEWAFYNDTLYYDMHLRYVLDKNSKIKANPVCITTKRPDGSIELNHILHPEETVTLFSGTVADFENLSKAVLLSEKYECPHKDIHAKQDGELAKIKAAAAAAGLKEDELNAEAVLRICVNAQLPFVDVDFFPNHKALYRPGVDPISIPTLPWKMPADYLPAGKAVAVHLLRGPLAANVVRKGKYFADVHFISALRLLADSPAVIKFLFYHPYTSKAGKMERLSGAYRVQLCSSGWWTGTVVDSYFPASAHAPEFGTCGDDLQALWVSILEKAYAKHFGSYSALQLSSVENTLRDLTGCPCTSLSSVWPSPRPKEAEVTKFVETLRAHFNCSGDVVLRTFPLSTASTQEKKDRLEVAYKELGLQPGYGVRVLGLETVGKFVLLRIRQVEGSTNEAFLDHTSKWLKVWTDAKKPWVDDVWSVVFGLDETSVLWMEAADVALYFQTGFLFYPVKAHAEIRAKGSFKDGRPSTCIKISVKKDTKVMFSVQQQDILLTKERGSARDNSVNLASSELKSFSHEDTYAAIGIQLYASEKKKKDKASWVHGNNSPNIFQVPAQQQYVFEREAALGANLTASGSPYYVVPCIRDKPSNPLPYVLSSIICKPPARCGPDEEISFQFVEIKESSTIFGHKDGKTAVLIPSTDVKVTETEFQSRWKEKELMQIKKQSEFIRT